MRARRGGAATATAVLAALVLGACGGKAPGPPPAPPQAARVDDAVGRATAFLLAAQSPDGAWRSEVYGNMKDDPALTPLVLKVLVSLGPTRETLPAIRRGAGYLASFVGADGRIEGARVGYPVYTSALAVMALTKLGDAEHLPTRNAWLAFLVERQLTEAHGFAPDDPAHGAFSYAARLDSPGEAAADANLSATLFALGALRATGSEPSDPELVKALGFVKRCQRHGTGEPGDDGGFVMSPINPTWNKTGVPEGGGTRSPSYGSMTADGLRALLACGEPLDAPRVLAAQGWLVERFSAREVPGDFSRASAGTRRSYTLYWLWSVAHLLPRLDHPATDAWAKEIALVLLPLQRADGSFANDFKEGREDDPIVGTCLAVGALAHSRRRL